MSGSNQPKAIALELNRRLAGAPSVHALLVTARRSIDDFDSIHAVTCLRRIALLKDSLTPRTSRGVDMERLVSRLRKDLSDGKMDAFSVASVSWSAATLGPAVPSLLDALPEVINSCTRLAPSMTSQGLTTTAWAFATLEVNANEARPFLAALAERASTDLHLFSAQDLAFTVWSFATLEFRDLPLMEAIASSSVTRAAEFKPKALANIAWAYAMLGIAEKTLISAIAAVAKQGISNFEPDDLANIASSFVLWLPGFQAVPLQRKRTRSSTAASTTC